MADKQICMLLLTLEKAIIKDYSVAITEASTKELSKKITKYLDESIDLQRKIFDLMSNNNWYPLTKATIDEIQKASEKLTNKCQCL